MTVEIDAVGDSFGNQEEDSEDDFFGNQEDDDDNEFGALGQQEDLAKQAELKKIGFLESYDTTKESRLQEGFEVGYREIYDLAVLAGETLGKESMNSFLETTSKDSQRSTATLNPKSHQSHSDTSTVHRLRAFLSDFDKQAKEDNLDWAKEFLGEFLEEQRLKEKSLSWN